MVFTWQTTWCHAPTFFWPHPVPGARAETLAVCTRASTYTLAHITHLCVGIYNQWAGLCGVISQDHTIHAWRTQVLADIQT